MSGAANTQAISEQKERDSGGEKQQKFAGSYRETADDNESGSEGGNYIPNDDEGGAGKSDGELRGGGETQYDDDEEELEITDFDDKPAGCICDMYVEGNIAVLWQYDEECPVSKEDHESVRNEWYDKKRESKYSKTEIMSYRYANIY